MFWTSFTRVKAATVRWSSWSYHQRNLSAEKLKPQKWTDGWTFKTFRWLSIMLIFRWFVWGVFFHIVSPRSAHSLTLSLTYTHTYTRTHTHTHTPLCLRHINSFSSSLSKLKLKLRIKINRFMQSFEWFLKLCANGLINSNDDDLFHLFLF